LVAYKKSRYQTTVVEGKDEHIAALIEHGDISVRKLERSHVQQMQNIVKAREALEGLDVEIDMRPREDVDLAEDYDLVVTIGGDGTVLDLSHQVTTTPILAINSDPGRSVGYFTAGTVEDLRGLAEQVLADGIEPMRLRRFAVRLNDDTLTEPVLNDVLVCHSNPAAVSSYIMNIDGVTEEQRSSGVWISTPAGSTAAIRSAGGYVLPLNSDNVQYLVREPYPKASGPHRLTKGIHPMATHFEIISKMPDGRIYLDGPHISYPFPIGDRLRVDASSAPLLLYGLDATRRLT